jgi:hypothetical protein
MKEWRTVMKSDDRSPIPQAQPDAKTPATTPVALNRRQALARLGLAAGTAYAAPTLLSLTEAKAQGGPPWGRPSRPTEPGEPGKKS